MSRHGLALFALLSVLWGVPYLLIKVAVAEVSVPFLVFARSALGAAILLPFAFSGSGFTTVRASGDRCLRSRWSRCLSPGD